MRSDASFTQRFLFESILFGLLIILSLGALLHHFPITFSTQDDIAGSVMPQQLGQSDVLLVLPDSSVSAQSYPQLDFSFAWYNFLSQYVGPFTIALAGDIKDASSLPYRLIVIPQQSAECFSAEQIQMVTRAVELGATLILEMPSHEWHHLTAIEQRPKISPSIKHFTDAPNTPLTGSARDQLLNTPLDTQAMRLDSVDTNVLTRDAFLLELDGTMAHYKRKVGSGNVFVLAFNFGQAVTAIQQGRPSDDFSLAEPVPKSSMLALSEKMTANPIPYADLLKLHVLNATAYAAPMPLLWPFPDGSRSALIISHETASLDDRAFKPAEYELEHEIRSTWLVTSDRISKKELQNWKNHQFDIGVAFQRPPVGSLFKKYGPSFFQPIAVESSLADQRKNISAQIGTPVTTCKFAQSQWSSEYVLAFRKLTAAQCQIDLSYAPSEPGQFGYLFGSAFPFLPIDHSGMPFPVYEFPIELTDETGLDALPQDFAVQLLHDSETLYHQPVSIHFNADTMLHAPTHRAPSTWLSVMQYAQNNRIWITTAKAFMYQYTLRKQAHIHYAFHPQTRVLDIKVALPKAPFNFTVALPRRTAYGSLHTIWLNKNELDLSVLRTTGDGLWILLPVPGSEHLIQVQYQ